MNKSYLLAFTLSLYEIILLKLLKLTSYQLRLHNTSASDPVLASGYLELILIFS